MVTTTGEYKQFVASVWAFIESTGVLTIVVVVVVIIMIINSRSSGSGRSSSIVV